MRAVEQIHIPDDWGMLTESGNTKIRMFARMLRNKLKLNEKPTPAIISEALYRYFHRWENLCERDEYREARNEPVRSMVMEFASDVAQVYDLPEYLFLCAYRKRVVVNWIPKPIRVIRM